MFSDTQQTYFLFTLFYFYQLESIFCFCFYIIVLHIITITLYLRNVISSYLGNLLEIFLQLISLIFQVSYIERTSRVTHDKAEARGIPLLRLSHSPHFSKQLPISASPEYSGSIGSG